jgi:kumamolisin
LAACSGHGASTIPSTASDAGGLGTDAAGRTSVAAAATVPHLSGALAFTDAGRRSPSAPVTIALTLAYNHQADLDRLVAEISNPRSGMYRHYITQRQFETDYAPTVAQEAQVVSALQKAGFTITQRYPNRTIVGASAPSSVVERFFSTEMHTVNQGKYGERFTNVKAVAAPSAIAPMIRDISVSNLVVVRTIVDQESDDLAPDRRATPTPKPSATPKPTATPTASPTPKPTATASPSASPSAAPSASPSAGAGGCNGAAADNGALSDSTGYLATGVAKAFDYPVQHGCNGAGQTVAIAIDDPVTASYTAAYLKAAGVTQTGTVTNEKVGSGGSGDEPEVDLDVQTISGLAPAANIIVYDMGSLTDQAIENTYNQVLTDGKAHVVNSSFGGCESSDVSFADSTNSIAEQGAATGVTFSASSGDSGSNECGNDNKLGVSAPAGGPYFISVGGLNFTESSSGVLETLTGTGDSGNGYKSGGGVSTTFALPSYQSGIPNMITSGRNQPDVSGPGVGVSVYTGGSFGEYDGTSWASPAIVALIAEVNELHGSLAGFVNPSLYSVYTADGYKAYTDCTSGSNGKYSCLTGYDQVSGIGAPQGWALANDL